MNFICVFFGILFCISGVVFACGKVHTRLSAWKAIPPEEKEKIRIMPLCRNIGKIIALSGIIFLLRGLWPALSGRWFGWLMIGWLVLAGFDVWYIEKSGRYREA